MIPVLIAILAAIEEVTGSDESEPYYGAATPYVELRSRSQRCYSYVLGELQYLVVGGSSEALDSYNVYDVALLVLLDAQRDGAWSHKPGKCNSRLVNGDNPSIMSWDRPKVDEYRALAGEIVEIGIVPSYYDSPTVYFAVGR